MSKSKLAKMVKKLEGINEPFYSYALLVDDKVEGQQRLFAAIPTNESPDITLLCLLAKMLFENADDCELFSDLTEVVHNHQANQLDNIMGDKEEC